MELGNVLLGESARLDYKSEDDDCSFGLDVKYICKESDPLSFDELVRNPLLGTLNGWMHWWMHGRPKMDDNTEKWVNGCMNR